VRGGVAGHPESEGAIRPGDGDARGKIRMMDQVIHARAAVLDPGQLRHEGGEPLRQLPAEEGFGLRQPGGVSRAYFPGMPSAHLDPRLRGLQGRDPIEMAMVDDGEFCHF
jgi:hypothetical protein